MSRHRPSEIDALLAEREWSTEQVWDAAEARLDQPVSAWLNTAHEACDRWARDRARIGLIVRHPDGRSERWTFSELARASSRLARTYHRSGLRRGDRVAAVVSRQAETFIAALAAWRAGLVYMPLFVGFGPDALAQRINAAQASLIVVDHRFRDLVAQTLPLLTDAPHVMTVAGPGGRGLVAGDHSFWAELDASSDDVTMVRTAASDTASLMFTSGTTGDPKGCIEPHSLPVTIQPFLRHAFALTPDDLLFAGADPGWSYGLYTTGIGVMTLGCPRVIYTGDFNPDDWLRVVAEEQVTFLTGAPSAFRHVARSARRRGLPASVRGASCAGEPLDAPLMEGWRELGGGEIQDGYGQTESAMLLANLAYEPEPLVPGSLASVVPGFEVRLVNEEGHDATGDEGILAMRRPRYQASVGYWNAPEKWAARWRGDWFLTGDVVRRDDDGRWWFVGRADDLIVSSGYNVGPTEVENVILAHPGVAEAAVIGTPDPDRGAVVTAVVVANGRVPQAQLTDELQRGVRERIGRHAYPRIVRYVDALPRTETGKLRRVALRDLEPTATEGSTGGDR